MSTILSTQAKELGTYVVTIAFTDEDGDAVVPNWIKWTLSTEDGETIINSREQKSIGTPAASVDIVLSGDDLQILAAETSDEFARRKITIESEYDSGLGSDLPLNDDAIFLVENLSYLPGAT